MRSLLALALLLGLSGAHAAVYKCTSPSGAVEFKDKPCEPGRGGEIQVKGVAPADSADGGSGSGGSLNGPWCEVAVSLDVDGEKDTSAPVQWNFGKDSVEYTNPLGTIKAPLARSETGFAVDNGMFGGAEREWEIVSVKGANAVVRSPVVGYYHFRKGSCP